jgi:dolichol-phosphate mannosyltransferase
VIPTYNEKENVGRLIERIDRALSGHKYEIVIVDDNSQDGTAEAASALSVKYPVRVIVRRDERGLGSAVVHGFNHTTSEIITVMDADLQHPPEVVADLLKAIDGGADLAIGSRYVEGGGCEGWSLLRRIVSKVAIFLSHLLLPRTRGISDPMSGFFMLRRSVVTDADLRPTGYKILLEIIMAGHYNKVVEVPFIFVSREKGESKLSSKTQLDYLKHLYNLMKRTGEIWRFVKFCLVGLSGVGVNEGIFWVLSRFAGLSREHSATLTVGGLSVTFGRDFFAQAISIESSILSNFIFNEIFTFRDRRIQDTSLIFRLLKFNVFCLAGAGIQMGIYALFNRVFGVYDLVSLLIGIAVATLWNYLLNTWWTWK